MTAEKENVSLYPQRGHLGAFQPWTLRKSIRYSPAGREGVSAAAQCYINTFNNITYYYYYYCLFVNFKATFHCNSTYIKSL